jgi:hypothetical protein
MRTPKQYMRKSAVCFHKLVRSHDLNTLERTFLSILAHALWEKGVELEGPSSHNPSTISRSLVFFHFARCPPHGVLTDGAFAQAARRRIGVTPPSYDDAVRGTGPVRRSQDDITR